MVTVFMSHRLEEQFNTMFLIVDRDDTEVVKGKGEPLAHA